jgi:hypothetical protein
MLFDFAATSHPVNLFNPANPLPFTLIKSLLLDLAENVSNPTFLRLYYSLTYLERRRKELMMMLICTTAKIAARIIMSIDNCRTFFFLSLRMSSIFNFNFRALALKQKAIFH